MAEQSIDPRTAGYPLFDLRIGAPNTDKVYPVTALLDGEERVEGHGLEQWQVEEWLRLSEPERVTRAMQEVLTAGPLLDAYQSLVSRSPDAMRVRLDLAPEAPELQRLPWERLVMPYDREIPLAADERRPFARLIDTGGRDTYALETNPVRLLLLAESALTNGEEPDIETVQMVIKALADPIESGQLEVTLWLGSEKAEQSNSVIPRLERQGFRMVDGHGPSVIEELGQMDIVHHAGFSRNLLNQVQTKVAYTGPNPESLHPITTEFLSWLDQARRLPPLVILSTPDEPGRLAPDVRGFADRGSLATLALSVADPIRTWDALHAFYSDLLDHGQIDLAANHLRARELESPAPYPLEPAVLWTTLRHGRLFAPADQRRSRVDLTQMVQQKPASKSPGDVTYLEDAGQIDDVVLPIRDAAEQRYADPTAQREPKTPASTQANAAADDAELPGIVEVTAARLNIRAESTTAAAVIHEAQKGERLRVTGAVRHTGGSWYNVETEDGLEGWAVAEFLSPVEVAATSGAEPETTTEAETGTPPATPASTPDAPAVTQTTDSGESQRDRNAEATPRAEPPAAHPGPSRSQPASIGTPGGGEASTVPGAEPPTQAATGGETGTPPPVPQPAIIQQTIQVNLARYEPPATDNKLQLDVGRERVTLEFRGSRYESRNRLQDEVVRVALEQARRQGEDPAIYGRLLFEAVVNRDVVDGDGDGETGLQEVGDTAQGGDTASGFQAAQTLLSVEGDDQRMGIELMLDKSVTYLHQQAWETIRPGRETPLALRESSPLYRRLSGRKRKLLVKNAPRLKVLVAICDSPAAEQFGLARLDVALERQIAERGLRRLHAAGLIDYTILPKQPDDPVTPATLVEALQDGCHVLHLVCHGWHGDLQMNGPEYYLVMEREAGEEGAARLPLVAPAELKTLLAGADDKLRLLVLAACQSAVNAGGGALAALGPRLVTEARIPAVIAMQENLPFSTAQLFTQSFYDDLARSGRIEMALAATRVTIATREGEESGTWSIPVLYMSTDDGTLLELSDAERQAAALLPRPPADVRTPQQLGAREDPQLAALRQHFTHQAAAVGVPGLAGALGGALQQAAGMTTSLYAPRQPRTTLATELDLQATLAPDELKAAIDATGLKLPADAYGQIAAALNMGKHIILLGPPGTGKTSLAHAICDYAKSRRFCRGKTVTTATADWTTFDTVGGLVPTQSQTLEFRPGSFLTAICDGHWLVIDEINRAEIDKAFGELFTILSGQQVDTPHTIGEHRVRILPPRDKVDPAVPESWIPPHLPTAGYDYVVHPNWRIIGTMNVYDRSSLYAMSLAFMRRFAFIDLGLPGREDTIGLWERWITEERGDPAPVEEDRIELLAILDELILTPGSQLMQYRALGPAIAKDMIRYLRQRYAPPGVVGRATIPDLLAEAFLLFAAPQLDGLDAGAIEGIYRELDDLLLRRNSAGRDAVLGRIEALYPFMPFRRQVEEGD